MLFLKQPKFCEYSVESTVNIESDSSSTINNPIFQSETDPNFLQVQKVQLVSTSVSSLESEVFIDSKDKISSVPNKSISMDMDRFQTEAKRLVKLRKKLIREMDDFTEDDVSTSRITVLERDLDRIKDLRDEYQEGVDDFIDEFSEALSGDANNPLDRWKADIRVIGKEVKAHADRIRSRKEELQPTSQLSEMEKKSLELQEATLKLQQLSYQEKKASAAAKVKEKEEEAIVLAETEANLFLGECSVLGQLMTEESWEEVDDEVISNAIRNLSKWQDQLNAIERSYRRYDNMSIKHNFPEEKTESIKATYLDRKERFEATKEAIIKEDADRGLFTLEPSRTDIIKYPVFSGLPSEDYIKFKETMEQRFRENKVKKKEQVAKLRECLKGAALGRVPDGIKDIEEAFSRLNEAFGNPSKVMNFNLKALEDLGTMPSEKLPNGQLS